MFATIAINLQDLHVLLVVRNVHRHLHAVVALLVFVAAVATAVLHLPFLGSGPWLIVVWHVSIALQEAPPAANEVQSDGADRPALVAIVVAPLVFVAVDVVLGLHQLHPHRIGLARPPI